MVSFFLNSLFLHLCFIIYPLSLSNSLLAKAWSEIDVIVFNVFRWVLVQDWCDWCGWDRCDLGGFWLKIGVIVFNVFFWVFFGYFLWFLAVEIGEWFGFLAVEIGELCGQGRSMAPPKFWKFLKYIYNYFNVFKI